MCAICYSPFPEVAESVQEELDTYRAQEDEVKRLKSIMVRHSIVVRVTVIEVKNNGHFKKAGSRPPNSCLTFLF